MRSTKVDHEEWRRLYAEDPDMFEQKRKQVINDFIASAPETAQKELRALQSLIDAETQLNATPLEACQAIIQMMNEKVDGKNGLRALHNRATGALEGLRNLHKKSQTLRQASEKFRDVVREINENDKTRPG